MLHDGDAHGAHVGLLAGCRVLLLVALARGEVGADVERLGGLEGAMRLDQPLVLQLAVSILPPAQLAVLDVLLRRVMRMAIRWLMRVAIKG